MPLGWTGIKNRATAFSSDGPGETRPLRLQMRQRRILLHALPVPPTLFPDRARDKAPQDTRQRNASFHFSGMLHQPIVPEKGRCHE